MPTEVNSEVGRAPGFSTATSSLLKQGDLRLRKRRLLALEQQLLEIKP